MRTIHRSMTIAGAVALAGAGLLGTSGCTVQTAPPPEEPSKVVTVADVRAERVATAPPRIESYPQVEYRGAPAYLVEDRWYYRTPDRGWVIFREEPRELQRYRVKVRAAPRPTPVVVIDGVRAETIHAPPSGWRNAPTVRYQGSDAYWVGEQWYYRTPDRGWVILREEPVELGRWRRDRDRRPPEVPGYVPEQRRRRD